MTTQYDSQAEEDFHKRHPELVVTKDNYSCWFKDDTGSGWRACPDFWNPETQQFIEFKDHKLNTHMTKAESEQKLQSVQQFKRYSVLIDNLKHGWNHSYIKQSIVQHTLRSNGVHMIVIFSDRTKLSPQIKNKMKLIGLKWQYESDYFNQETSDIVTA